jgi:hypothetical protein
MEAVVPPTAVPSAAPGPLEHAALSTDGVAAAVLTAVPDARAGHAQAQALVEVTPLLPAHHLRH